MKILYIDPIGGLSGDMMLGGFVDLGWSLESLRAELASLGLDRLGLEVESRIHRGITSRGVVVSGEGDRVERRLPEIETLLRASDDSAPPHRKRAVDVFRRLVDVEAKIHNQPPEEVHLHEVGALDAIVDIVGACLALEELTVGHLFVGPLPLGTGTTESVHGRIPVPAPATLELLKGAIVQWTGEEGEKVTPTGAALAVTLADGFGPPPPMIVDSVGWGGGSRPSAETGRPNVVRLVLGEPLSAVGTEGTAWEHVAVLSCHIDDMTPEEIGHLSERLMEEGALDFFVGQGVMKKGRPGWSLRVLSLPTAEPTLRSLLLEESTTLGVRSRLEGRWALPRQRGRVETPYGAVEVKWIRRGHDWVAEPEYESLRLAARRAGVPVRRVAQGVREAARRRGPENPHSRG